MLGWNGTQIEAVDFYYFIVCKDRNTERLEVAGYDVQSGPPRCRGLFRGIASPAVLCHKEPARTSKAPY